LSGKSLWQRATLALPAPIRFARRQSTGFPSPQSTILTHKMLGS
jgi:hypothetical protein